MALQQQRRLEGDARQYGASSARLTQLRSERDALRGQGDSAAEKVSKLTEEIDKLDQSLQELGPSRERYYEFYFYEIQSVVMSAVKASDAKGQDTLSRMAIRLVKLEQGQPDFGGPENLRRFRELVASNDNLKQKYSAAGGKALTDASQP
jgi:chromosome segregation ATPase